MKTTVRLGRDSLWLIAGRVGIQVLALFTILLARKLGSVGFGEYAFFTTVIVVANVFTTSGTDMYFIREIAARDDLSRLPAVLWMQLLLSGLFIIGALVVGPFLPNQSADSILALQIYSMALIPMSFYSVFTTVIRGKQRMDLYAQLNLLGALLQTFVVVLFLAGLQGIVTLAFLMLGTQVLLALVAGWLSLFQGIGFWHNWHFSWPDVRAVFFASASLGFLGLFGMFYQKAGVLLLSTLSGAALTGLYVSALRVVDASKLVHYAALTALYPLMAQSESSEVVQRSWKLLLAWALLLAVGLSLLAAPIVDLLYGPQFSPAIPILHILAWTLIPYSISSFLALSFVAGNRPRVAGWALTVALSAVALLSFWWIPAYGLVGAAWAAFSAESLQAIVLLAHLPQCQKLFQGAVHEFSKLS